MTPRTNLPSHISLNIEHNPHKEMEESVCEYVKSSGYLRGTFPPGDLEQCMEDDEIWSLQWYVDLDTSIRLTSFSLERCCELASFLDRTNNTLSINELGIKNRHGLYSVKKT